MTTISDVTVDAYSNPLLLKDFQYSESNPTIADSGGAYGASTPASDLQIVEDAGIVKVLASDNPNVEKVFSDPKTADTKVTDTNTGTKAASSASNTAGTIGGIAGMGGALAGLGGAIAGAVYGGRSLNKQMERVTESLANKTACARVERDMQKDTIDAQKELIAIKERAQAEGNAAKERLAKYEGALTVEQAIAKEGKLTNDVARSSSPSKEAIRRIFDDPRRQHHYGRPVSGAYIG